MSHLPLSSSSVSVSQVLIPGAPFGKSEEEVKEQSPKEKVWHRESERTGEGWGGARREGNEMICASRAQVYLFS